MAASPTVATYKLEIDNKQASAAVRDLLAQLRGLSGVKVSGTPLAGISAGAGLASAAVAGVTAALAAVAAAAAAAGVAFKRGIAVNAEMETVQLGIKGIIGSLYEIRDASGNLAEGPEALAIAGGIAEKQLAKLRLAGMQTAAEFKDLAEAYQVALGAGATAGFDPDQVRELTVSLTLAAGSFGLAGTQLVSEIRSVLSGQNINTSQIATGLGITGAQIKLWREQGRLAEELNARLKVFAELGEEAGKTWTNTLSGIADAMSMVLGNASKGAFDRLKASLAGILSAVIDTATGELQQAFEGLADFARDVFGRIGNFLADAIDLGVQGAQALSGWFADNQEQLGGVLDAVALLGKQIWGLLAPIGKVLAGIGSWAVSSNALRMTLDVIGASVAMLTDGFKLVAGAVGALVQHPRNRFTALSDRSKIGARESRSASTRSQVVKAGA